MSVSNMKSGNIINYSLRVAKNIERKMIKDALVRLFGFSNTNNYEYIGFGSKYFTDFLLFHKYLHIDKMTSIEADVDNKEKYKFNKPLKCIEMKFGLASDVISTMNFTSPSIVWLDYDGLLETSYLNDLSEVVTKSRDGSVVIISYNSRPLKAKFLEGYTPGNELNVIRDYVKSLIDDKYIELDENFKGFGKWDRYSAFLRTVVLNAIRNSIDIKNRGLNPSDKFCFKQIFNFNYKDGVEMSTLGFVIHKVSTESNFENCQFQDFDFYRCDSDSYVIEVPMLTSKEIKALVEQMPLSGDALEDGSLPRNIFTKKDIDNFSRIYKYNPMFNDSEMT